MTKSKTDEQIVGEAIGRTIGHVAFYFVMKRLGAPRYVAYIATHVNSHMHEQNNPLDKDRVTESIINLFNKFTK